MIQSSKLRSKIRQMTTLQLLGQRLTHALYRAIRLPMGILTKPLLLKSRVMRSQGRAARGISRAHQKAAYCLAASSLSLL